MRPYILLTPGPLSTSETVKEVMLQDWCTWDDDYNVAIVQNIRTRLVNLATNRPDNYTSVLMQGSGTFVVEGTLVSCVGKNHKLLILSNGAYGERMEKIARRSSLAYEMISWQETETVCPATLHNYLNDHKDITHVAFVHCETTTGILNPLEELCRVVKSHDKCLIVDAISSFGGIPFDVAALEIDFMIGSANKCIQGVPGFGYVIVKKSSLKTCKGLSTSLSLDIYDQWETMEKNDGKWRFTSPTHVVRAFKQSLDELDAEGGIVSRNKRYNENRKTLVKGMECLGFKRLLIMNESPIITSFLYPESLFSFIDFYNKLKMLGFVIYPGKISEANTFRIGTIGDVSPSDFRNLIKAIENIKL